MLDKKDIAGVVLAGGRSSRMGQNKALLDYKGEPLIEHMMSILKKTGFNDVYISGEVEGYACISDRTAYDGPAQAISHVMSVLDNFKGVVFVPVDMPLLTPDVLDFLLMKQESAFYCDCFLPAYIKIPHPDLPAPSVREMLKQINAHEYDLPERFKPFMRSANTPDEWQKVIGV